MFATTLAVFSPVVVTFFPTDFRWSQGELPIPYCIITNATRTNLTQTQQREQMELGINYWRSSGAGGGTSGTSYDAVRASYPCVAEVDPRDTKNNLFFERNRWQYGSGVLGVTHLYGYGNCGSARADDGRTYSFACMHSPDMELNDTNNHCWDAVGSNCSDLSTIVAHEYGHFLGLDHCNENNTCNYGTAVMYAAYGGGRMSLRPDDEEGVRALYPGDPGGIGYPCTNASGCDSNMCLSPGTSGYCTQTCGTCPVGYKCEASPQFQNQNVCIRDDGSNRALCEVCQGGLPHACADNGVCIAGIPESNTGRCATPCPQPQQPDGGCPNLYTCVTIRNAGYYCIPQSSDCTNLNGGGGTLEMGQACDGNPPCVAGLDCIEICTKTCTGVPNQGTCPNGYACETFQFQSGPEDYCAPPVREGQNCSGLKACPTGPCLSAGSGPTCYLDCAQNAGACNSAQQCNTYQLQGGGTVSICEPPGVQPRYDAGINPLEDATTSHEDAQTGDPDAGSSDGADPVCACNARAGICEGSCACDPDCPCACDTTTCPDPDCSCDPDPSCGGSNQLPVRRGDCSCRVATVVSAPGATPWSGMALVLLVGTLFFVRWRRNR